MNKFTFFLILFLSIFLIFSGGGNVNATDSIEKEKLLSEGEYTLIVLEVNRTAGLEWHYNVKNKDKIEIIFDEYIPPYDVPEERDGAPGERVLCIRGIENGETEIKFELYPPWRPKDIRRKIKFNIKIDSS